MEFYPLQFYPILKDRIWGGTKLKSYLGKPIQSNTTGESWEISTVEDSCSIIKNGLLEGRTLTSLIDLFPIEILGKKVYENFGKQFPLLIKFIDAREDLSIQVHPNDYLAKKRHNSFGKTEMWYVMQADEGARLIVGFKQDSSYEEYINCLENKTLLSLLDNQQVNDGDVFFLETGTVHAIGGGIMIAEIQQTSDITYRLYDFDRVDKNGNQRELHLDLAKDAINFNVVNAKIDYNETKNTSNEIIDCNYFTTNFLPVEGILEITKNQNSFIIYICTKGVCELHLENQVYNYKLGDVILIPAVLTNFKLLGSANLLEVFLKD